MAMSNDPVSPYTTAVQTLNLPAEWQWRVELRPRRRSVGATVEPGGQIIFAVPPVATPEQLASSVRSMRGRLDRMVTERSRFSATKPVKELVSGEGFPLLGRNHRLRITEPGPQQCCVFCREQWVRDPAVPVLARRMHAAGLSSRPTYDLSVLPTALNAKAIIGWYRQQGQAWVDEHAHDWIQRVRPAEGLRVVVRDIGRRKWGHYKRTPHLIELHWALFQLDHEFVEYTLVHELAHATRPGGKPHGSEWQRVMDLCLFGWRERQRRMAESGDRVWLGDVAPRQVAATPAAAPDPWGPTLRALNAS